MARNREHVKPVEPQSDSGEEEDEDDSSEESDSQESDSEPEPEPTQTATQKKPQPQMATKSQQLPPQQAPSSSEEDESGSETESESDGPDSNAGPPASKPMEESQKSSNGSRKARSKPNAPEPVTPTNPAAAAAKRPAEGTATKNTKRLRKTVESDPSEKKSNLFQRLWSEDDEIVILKGMITSKYKSDPIWDLNAFHDFIKKNLHIDVTRTQLQDKIRRLKKKYENNKSKEKEGKERTFSKPHEQNAYDLSKVIWGNETGKESGGVKVVGSPKANGSIASKTASKKVNAAESEEAKDVKNAVIVSGEGEKLHAKRLNSNSVGATMEERMLIAGGEYFGLGQGLEGEQDWQKLRVKEFELLQKQLELRVAQTKLVLEVMKLRNLFWKL